jgi:putative tricarboxylic transport membrane protein
MPALRALPVISLSFLVVGGAYLIESLHLPLGPAAQPGPGLFPLLVGIAMVAFSLRLFIQSLKTEEGPAEKEDPFPKGKDLQRVVVIAGTLIFFAVFLNILGYGVCSAVLIGAVLRLLGLKSWAKILLISVLTAAFSYLLFASVLEAPLPRGVLFS